MHTAFLYAIFLVSVIIVVWTVARKVGRADKELAYVKQDNERQRNAGEILNRYINLNSYELSERVLEKRKNARKRMSTKD